MDDNTNKQKVDSLDSLEFSLDDNDLDALRNNKSTSSNKVDNSSSFEVTDMEISWEDSLEALRQERAKLSQQVLQHEPVEAVPLVFEQAVQEAIQEQVIDDDVFVEIEPTTEESAVILHDDPLSSMLDEVGLVADEDYKTAIESSSIHTDSVSFKAPSLTLDEESESESLDHIDYLDDSDEGLSVELESESIAIAVEPEVVLELEPVSNVELEIEPIRDKNDEKTSDFIDFEKIKQEALARAQNKPIIDKEKEVVRMVNPAINFNIQKNDAETDGSAIRPKEKLSTGSFSAAQIAAATNMVKPKAPSIQADILEVKAEEPVQNTSIVVDLGKEDKILSSQVEETPELEVTAEAPAEEIHIEPLQAATLRRSYEQEQTEQSKASISPAAPVKSIMTPAQEKAEKENIPELNLAVPEKKAAYEDVSAEVITQEPVSLVGEAQLVAAILADLQPHLEKIIASYVHEEIVKQTVILVKNVSANLEKELPNLLSETLSVQINKAMQRVKNPLQS